MRLLIVKLLCFSLKEILRVGCIILRGSYTCRLFSVVGCRLGGELDERNGHQTHQSNRFFMMTCARLTD